MRFAAQLLTGVDQLRFFIGTKNGHGTGIRINNPDESNSDRDILLDHFVNLFLGIAGRQDLDHQHGHAIDQRCVIGLSGCDFGGDIDDIDAGGDATSSILNNGDPLLSEYRLRITIESLDKVESVLLKRTGLCARCGRTRIEKHSRRDATARKRIAIAPSMG